MAIDKLAIGQRVRYIREEIYKETRSDFSYRCSITETHLGQIERGEILASLNALDKIATCTNTEMDFLLYGKKRENEFPVEQHLKKLIENSSEEKLDMYFKCISAIEMYLKKKE